MTIPNSTPADRYTGDGATSSYDTTFKIQDDDDVEVSVTTTADANTVLDKTTHYTVTINTSTATILLLSPYNNLTSGYILTLRLKPALNNSTSFATSNRVTTRAIEDAVDRLSQRIIRLSDDVDRSIKLPVWEAGTTTKTNLGDAASRASKYLTFDSSGNASASTTVAAGAISFTSIGETIAEAASASAVLDALGFTSPAKAIIDDPSNAAIMTTLGITSPAQSILDDVSIAAIRATLGLDGASGNITSLDIADAATAQIFQARLTLTSATPVTTSDVTGAGTLYLTPYKGNKIAVYNGTRWKLMALTEISLAITATSGSVYDVFVYDNSGTLTLETLVWTNTTTRATALAYQDGVLCKTGALTRRYVGTFVAYDTNQITDSVVERGLWNFYNQEPRRLLNADDASWTHSTATATACNSGALAVEIVFGLYESLRLTANLMLTSSNGSAGVRRVAGFSATVGSTEIIGQAIDVTAAASNVVPHVSLLTQQHLSGVGYRALTAANAAEATGTTTWTDTLTASFSGVSSDGGITGFIMG
jgi:hypothetical protein